MSDYLEEFELPDSIVTILKQKSANKEDLKKIDSELKKFFRKIDGIMTRRFIVLESRKEFLAQENKEFLQEVKSIASKYGELLAEKEISDARAFALQLKLGGRRTIEKKEEDVFTDWLLRNQTLSRSQKWSVALYLEVTPLAKAIAKKLTESSSSIATFSRLIETFYNTWSHQFYETPLKPPLGEYYWNELCFQLEICGDSEKIALKTIFSEYKKEGEKSEDKNTDNSTERVDESNAGKSSKNPGYMILGNVNFNATSEEIQEFFDEKQVKVFIAERLYTHEQKSKKAGMLALSVDDISLASQVAEQIPEKLANTNPKKVHIIAKHSKNEL